MGVSPNTPRAANPSPSELAPPVSGTPPICGDFGIRIARDGTWFYHGSPIGRKPLVKLFATILHRVGDEYWLINPAERGRILVDDVPFVAVEVAVRGEGKAAVLDFRTNLDDWVSAGPDHPIRVRESQGGEPIPYLMVRDGLEARIHRPVFYELAALSEERDGMMGVWSGGVFFPLGRP